MRCETDHGACYSFYGVDSPYTKCQINAWTSPLLTNASWSIVGGGQRSSSSSACPPSSFRPIARRSGPSASVLFRCSECIILVSFRDPEWSSHPLVPATIVAARPSHQAARIDRADRRCAFAAWNTQMVSNAMARQPTRSLRTAYSRWPVRRLRTNRSHCNHPQLHRLMPD